MSGSGQLGYADNFSLNTDHNALEFMIRKQIGKMATATLVKVVGVTNNGEVSPVGRIDVMPLVHQIDPKGNATPHGTIYSVPYVRHGGGNNAIIMDPQVGDIGMLAHSSRDISGVLATRDFSVPQSRRWCDWQDAIYVGQTLNLSPGNYIRFHPGGIDVVTTNALTITANNITLDQSGNLAVKGEITAGQGGGDQVAVQTHRHSNVQGGPGTSGPPVAGT